MDKTVFTLRDLAKEIGLTEDVLLQWTKAKLIRPAGVGDGRIPLFLSDALDRIAHVRKLEALGYSLEEIQKILKKFGVPNEKNAAGGKAEIKKSPYLTVGDLAERSGVSPRTIKHWEDKGIIAPDMRTEGGFRLYSETYVFLCQLIRDLQLFGYTLEEIKVISDDVRAFVAIQADLESLPEADVEAKLGAVLREIEGLFDKMKLLEEGIERWRDLLKRRRKDIMNLQAKNRKRGGKAEEVANV